MMFFLDLKGRCAGIKRMLSSRGEMAVIEEVAPPLRQEKSILNFFLRLIGIFVFSAVIVFTPWEGIRDYEFVDFQRNLGKIETLQHKNLYYSYSDSDIGVLKSISNELLWEKILIFLGGVVESPEALLKLIAFLSSFIMVLYAVRRSGFWISIALLLNPVFLDFVISQQRSAFALSILLLGLMVKSTTLKVLFFGLSAFIHTISMVVLALFFYCRYVISFLLTKNRALTFFFVVAAAFTAAFTIAFGRDVLLGFLGDRRSGDYEAGAHSILYAFPWLVYSLIMFFFIRRTKYDWESMFPVISIVVFFSLSFLNFYSIRFLAFALPFFPGAMARIGWHKRYLIPIVLVHQALLMKIWLKI